MSKLEKLRSMSILMNGAFAFQVGTQKRFAVNLAARAIYQTVTEYPNVKRTDLERYADSWLWFSGIIQTKLPD